jgi:hypothetical protein
VANGEQATLQGWSKDLFDRVDELDVSCRKQHVPRLYLTGYYQRLMASLPTRANPFAKLQLATTSLETFYIDPAERQYLWSPKIRARVQEVVGDSMDVSDHFFDRLRQSRNDAAHRAGMPPQSDASAFEPEVLITAECILRLSIRWALWDIERVGEAFSQGKWPTGSETGVPEE